MQKPKRVGLYLRVSTGLQDPKAQKGALQEYAANRGWTVTKIYTDKISGAVSSRPALDELMADCRARRLDAIVVLRFDRFARSLRHLVTALDEFKRLGIDFISATEAIDTTLPSGELVFQIFGAIAQFERTLICERVKSGLAEARRRGQRLGRQPTRILSETEIATIKRERRKGVTLRKLAIQFRAPLTAVYRASLTRSGVSGQKI